MQADREADTHWLLGLDGQGCVGFGRTESSFAGFGCDRHIVADRPHFVQNCGKLPENSGSQSLRVYQDNRRFVNCRCGGLSVFETGVYPLAAIDKRANRPQIKLNAMAVDPISHQPVTSKVTDRAVIAFANNCPALLEVDLHACKQITSTSVVALLSTLRALRELRLPLCSEINNSAFLNLPPKKIYESLRILDLTECDQMRDEGVIRIINAAPRLRNLVLAKCRFITDRSVQAICKLGKNLHYVHLGHCSLITDAAVLQLIKSCNRIRYIDLACCNRLTDESVSQLSSLPKLKRIGLVKCQAITDRSILALAKGRHAASGPSSLERVHLSYCVNLTMKVSYSPT